MDKYFKKYNKIVKGSKNLLELSGYVEGEEEYLYHHMVNNPITANLTSIHEFYQKNDVSAKSNVLITTGSFAPMHPGHIELAIKGIEEIETETGDEVIGCWYSIDHKNYVNNKKNVNKYSTMERINHAQKMLDPYNKLHIDYWSSLYSPTDVNFTTVYERFQNYIKNYFPNNNIKLWYIVGGDHMEFLNAFTEHGYGVAIPRGGYSNNVKNITPEALERCIIAKNTTQKISSTMVRRIDELDEKKHIKNTNGNLTKKENIFLIRNDVKDSLKKSPIELHLDNSNRIYKDICKILKKYLPNDIIIVENIFNQMKKPKSEKIISLDPFTLGDHNLHITRVFEAFEGQYSNYFHTHRIEHENLNEQIKKLSDKEYHLVDDDIITGGTIKIIMEMLKKSNITIKELHSLTNVQNAFDVVDCRDLIVGSNYGGLTVQYFGKNYRAPYIFPYVNLNSRAKIKSNEILPLSIELWSYNSQLYKHTGVKISNLKHSIFQVLPLPQDTLVSELCNLHQKLLKTINKNIK